MTKAKGFRLHTSPEFDWIAEKNFYNVVCYNLPILEKIIQGKHLSTSGELFTKRERLRLKRVGVIDYQQFRNPWRSVYTVTPEALKVMASLSAPMPIP